MKRVLITGANSFVGLSVEKWLHRTPEEFHVNTVDMLNDKWRDMDFSPYDCIFHVAGIAHVDPKPTMAPLYYRVNRDLAIEVAKKAKECRVKQFIYMSSRIVFHASKSLRPEITFNETQPNPNDFYGDSKLQAEKGLTQLDDLGFKVVILRPCMIYGPGCKGNFPKLVRLAQKTPVFPEWHNKRSMLYIDNLCELVRQVILREERGIFHPQNSEFADTVEIVRFFAKVGNHRIWISRLFNPMVILGSLFIKQVPKMFADSYYVQEMSKYSFDYQIVSFQDSLERMRSLFE